MCGLLGIISNKIDKPKFEKSLELLNHRGPDSKNIISFKNVLLGQTRLSIQDLSEKGNQPFYDKESENYIIFNGEIYNFKILRKSLKEKGIIFHSQSDTEVILKLYNIYGINKTLQMIEGMFSFIILNTKENKLFACRDKFGMKPLFFKKISRDEIIFSSEIKPINNYYQNYKLKKETLAISAVMGFYKNGETLFKDINEVKPGEKIEYNLKDNDFNQSSYSSILDLIEEDYYNYLTSLPQSKLLKVYDDIFRDSVNLHLISDAPTSILYSGGLDSSLIAKYASEKSKINQFFFFNSFHQKKEPNTVNLQNNNAINLNIYNEKENELILEIPEMIYRNECILNASGSALMLIANFAKKNNIKSMLTGDGADELFAGYETHAFAYSKMFLNENFLFKKLFKLLNVFLPGAANFDDKIENNFLSDYLITKDLMTFPFQILSDTSEKLDNWQKSLNKYSFIKNNFEKNYQSFTTNYFINNMNRYLVRSDRAGMSRSVELRTPFLNTNLVKLALNTPLNKKIKYNLFSRDKGLNKITFLKQKIILKKLAKYTGGINQQTIESQKVGIFMDIEKIKLLIKKMDFKMFKDYFEISSKNFNFYINKEKNELILWGFFQIEIFLRIFINNDNYEDIKKELKSKL